MLRTVLGVTGVGRGLADLRYRLEERAESAISRVKSIAIRIAVAAALAIAAVIFTLLALIVGLMVLYVYLEPNYGVSTSLAIIGGILVAVALLCVLAAALIGRGKSDQKSDIRKATATEDRRLREDEWQARRPAERQYAMAARQERQEREVEALNSLVALSRRQDVLDDDRVSADALRLLQTGDRRTMFAVLSAVAALGWLMGRTMPRTRR
jgi:hypothetical protein